MNKIVLGRGIGALIPDGEPTTQQGGSTPWADLAIEKIRRNPDQPRREFDPVRLAELSESIRRDGMLQPILVRVVHGEYELIAGERRMRAAQMAGLTSVPARVFEHISDRDRAILAMVENLQREDLNPLEEASGYHELQERYGFSQEELAVAVGKDRSTVANTLRLLRLPDNVRDALQKGELTAGHGRALLAIEDAGLLEKTARKSIHDGWSVRRLEKEISGRSTRRGRPLKSQQNHRWTALEDALKRKFGTSVAISHRLGKGRVVFEYYSEEELTRLMDLFEVRLD
jgi:ParB family chromosome partitioning protein